MKTIEPQTPYERFQMERYGNILPSFSEVPEEEMYESGIDEINRLAEWTESMAEQKIQEVTND